MALGFPGWALGKAHNYPESSAPVTVVVAPNAQSENRGHHGEQAVEVLPQGPQQPGTSSVTACLFPCLLAKILELQLDGMLGYIVLTYHRACSAATVHVQPHPSALYAPFEKYLQTVT